MRKLILTSLLAVFAASVFAQKIGAVKDAVDKRDWKAAKEVVDKFLANPKNANNADAWYYKGKTYNSIARDSALASLMEPGQARKESFEAFKKYYELEPKNIMGTLEQNVWLFDIYNGFYEVAANAFNTKSYDEALTNFKDALEVEEFIHSKDFNYNGFSFPAFDTAMIQNLAASAFNAKKEDIAMTYYQQIADQKVGGKDYMGIYQFMIEYFAKKNDMANFNKYLAIAEELYPGNYLWVEEQMELAGEDQAKRFAKYEELMPKYPKEYFLFYNYAVELFNYLYTNDSKPADYKQVQNKIEDVLKKALQANPDGAEANLLMARHMYNVTFDLQDEIRANKGQAAADKKKREDTRVAMMNKFEELLPYAQAGYKYFDTKGSLKPSEKGSFKLITEILVAYYDIKKDIDTADKYREKMKNIF